MECNRDEATRAKEIAERKFSMRDVNGAKKFALKAQNLFPGLEGISQMISTLDVHISAENKIGGEPDWYGVLGVNPSSDDETVKKQYRKLALMLHPDKNKSVGADGAFKLISEAWSLLSDKIKRIAYDQKRLLNTLRNRVPSATGGSPVPPSANGFRNFTTTSSNMKAQKTSSKVGKGSAPPDRARASDPHGARAPTPAPPPPPPHPSKPNTFWTVCNRCKMQYEYLRVYLHHNLLCPNCKEPFYASETAAPPLNGSNSAGPWTSSKQRQNSNHESNKRATATGWNSSSGPNITGFDSLNQSNFQWAPFSKTTSSGSAKAAVQAANVVQQVYEKVRREREEAQAAARRQDALQRKTHVSKRTASGLYPDLKGDRVVKKRRSGHETVENTASQVAPGNGVMGTPSSSGLMQSSFEKDKLNLFSVNKPNCTRELTTLEVKVMWAEKARNKIHKKLDELKLTAAGKGREKENGKIETTVEEREKERAAVTGVTDDQDKGNQSIDVEKGADGKTPSLDLPGLVLETQVHDSMLITVPDPDFHDFDRDRSERSFGDNQVWAAYDDDDGMPRYYAMIHKVISSNPFKVKISWLNSKTNTELSSLNWIGSGFSKTCGDFRVGRYESNDSLNSFSHKVKWIKGSRGAVRIFPRKGDVWAVYRNWSPDWNELTPDEVIHKYDMMEVLEDYNDDHGVSVTPLVKVAGFKTVFHKHLDPTEVRRIPREEMFRFSHQVPSYLLTGSEGQGAPKGCRELDPAATPLELLQVITEAKEEMEIVEEQTITEQKKQDFVEIRDDEMVVDSKEEKAEAEACDVMEIVEPEGTDITKNDEKHKVAEGGTGEKYEETETKNEIVVNGEKHKGIEVLNEILEKNDEKHEETETKNEIVVNGDKHNGIEVLNEILEKNENQKVAEADNGISENDGKQHAIESANKIVENGEYHKKVTDAPDGIMENDETKGIYEIMWSPSE